MAPSPALTDPEALAMIRQWIVDLWNQDDGTVVYPEWMLIASVLVLGTIASIIAVHYVLLKN